MGGVDRSDQLIKYYNVLRQTKKYRNTLLFHYIDVAVVKAYILHKECASTPLSRFENIWCRVSVLQKLDFLVDRQAGNLRAAEHQYRLV